MAWPNQDLILYHGTVDVCVASIRAGVNVNVASLSRRTDFGRGFYTTTKERQARVWSHIRARRKAQRLPGCRPAVVSFRVSRDALAKVEDLCFVRGAADAKDFWGLVRHCRSLRPAHGRGLKRRGWYDLIVGPVVQQLRQRVVFSDSDQISFHTKNAANVLDKSPKQARVFNAGQWVKLP